MKYLLDTHILLWALLEPNKLSQKAQKILLSEDNKLFFSPGSLWEIVIKNQLGRDDFCVDANLIRRTLLDNGYEELQITSAHTVFISSLPHIHKDPFDRLLIAQAVVEGIMLMTHDSIIKKYEAPIFIV